MASKETPTQKAGRSTARPAAGSPNKAEALKAIKNHPNFTLPIPTAPVPSSAGTPPSRRLPDPSVEDSEDDDIQTIEDEGSLQGEDEDEGPHVGSSSKTRVSSKKGKTRVRTDCDWNLLVKNEPSVISQAYGKAKVEFTIEARLRIMPYLEILAKKRLTNRDSQDFKRLVDNLQVSLPYETVVEEGERLREEEAGSDMEVNANGTVARKRAREE